MSLLLPLRRSTSSSLQCTCIPVSHTQIRHATLLRRPKRPYTFTQLVTLSDGSSFLHRTTSPAPVYKSNKDTRNTVLWNPTNHKLLNSEVDEAGKLRAFRAKFGRGWDAEGTGQEGGEEVESAEKNESLMDLITGFVGEENDGGSRAGKGKGKGKGNEGKENEGKR